MRAIQRSVALGIILGGAAVCLAAQADNPRVGEWRLNVAKSKYDPGPPPKSQTLKIVAEAKGENVTSEMVSADGTKVTTHYTAQYDGKDYPLTGSPTADTVSIKQIDSHTTERTDKKSGKAVQTLTRTVSKDGKTMTVTVKGTDMKGRSVNNVVVFEKR
jgi:hypothetical protein